MGRRLYVLVATRPRGSEDYGAVYRFLDSFGFVKKKKRSHKYQDMVYQDPLFFR
jgi:hypothetical protein